jgi:hypothetical protein
MRTVATKTLQIFSQDAFTEFMKWRKSVYLRHGFLHLHKWRDIASDFDARADA